MYGRAVWVALVFWQEALGFAVFVFCAGALIPVWLLATHLLAWLVALRWLATFVWLAGMAYGAFRKRREMGRSRPG